MNRLITAGWYRVSKYWAFWVLSAVVVYLGIDCGLGVKNSDWTRCVDLSVYLAVVIVAMAILNIAIEYSSHSMRNKLSIGHTKAKVFLAELILNMEIACLYLSVVLVIVQVLAGSTLQGIDGRSIVELLGVLYLFYVELVVMVTVTCLLCTSGIQGGIVSVVTLFAVPLWLCRQIQLYFLNVFSYGLNVEKRALYVGSKLVHHGVSEEAARFWQVVFDILLGGQWVSTTQCIYVFVGLGGFDGVSGFDNSLPYRQMGYSLFIIGIFIVAGYLLFRKKEIK